MFPYIVIGIVLFGLYYYFWLPRVKKAKEENEKRLKEQLLRLFVSGEKMTGMEVHQKLEERTSGRCPHLAFIYKPLKSLVKDDRLVSETTEPIIDGQKYTKTVYFLPEQKWSVR